jgi:hypothetical protein
MVHHMLEIVTYFMYIQNYTRNPLSKIGIINPKMAIKVKISKNTRDQAP